MGYNFTFTALDKTTFSKDAVLCFNIEQENISQGDLENFKKSLSNRLKELGIDNNVMVFNNVEMSIKEPE